MSEFRDSAPSAPAVFYRSYSRRKEDGVRENFEEAITRTVNNLADIGGLSDEQRALCLEMGLKQHTFPSGRALWVAGTEWATKPENYPGFYNCSSMKVDEPSVFGLLMNLAMMGTGTGAVLEQEVVDKLPPIVSKLNVIGYIENPGTKGGQEDTEIDYDVDAKCVSVIVGDSRQGWVAAYQGLINLAMGVNCDYGSTIDVLLDLSEVRGPGEQLKGFGGTANPIRLRTTLERVTSLLAKAVGRKLTPLECCLLIDEAASAVVAGNIRRSAGMRQGSEHDEEFAIAKDNLYKQDADGNWSVDPEREALRLANHTRVWHHKPSYEEILESVEKQFRSGEGAIQYAPEAIARGNADLLNTPERKRTFLDMYCVESKEAAQSYLEGLAKLAGEPTDEKIMNHRMHRYGLNPCAEINGTDFMCNLSEIHLNTLVGKSLDVQRDAFYAGGLQVAALLQHHFTDERLQYSREHDPIVAVSFTGLFSFFVETIGVKWLDWMMRGRPYEEDSTFFEASEAFYLTLWRDAAKQAVLDYCSQHGLKAPNRFTAVQPAGSKSLLTGASSGWHAPIAQRYIRRITFGKQDPLVAALRDYGYKVVPAQSARDDDGNLLDDVNDPRVSEVLVEIPTEVSWANLPGADSYCLSQLPVEAQFKLYMAVQQKYSTHTTSATLEFREDEIETLSRLIYDEVQADGGYISAALLARFDANETFPRMPFEPIEKQAYDAMMAQLKAFRVTLPKDVTVLDLLHRYDHPDHELSPQDTACSSGACVAKADEDERKGVKVVI